MSDLSQREQFRALTDALPEGESLTASQMRAGVPDPKPSLTRACTLAANMVRARQLILVEAPGRQRYRSGPEPVVPLAVRLHQPRARKGLGNAALVRLMDSDVEADRAAFARITAADGPEWRRGA